MKNFLLLISLLTISFSYAQTLTKKYNSYEKRNEFFNSYGTMVGYEKYNSYSNQWEYYELNSSEQRQPTKYRNPEKIDLGSLGNAMRIKQQRYENNLVRFQAVVDDIASQIDNLELSPQQKRKIKDGLNDGINRNMATVRRGEIDWLYQLANILIKDSIKSKAQSNVIPKSPTRSTDNSDLVVFEDYFNKTLNVNRIARFDSDNNTFFKDEKIESNSYIVFNDNMIRFKRADGQVLIRELSNKRSTKYGYRYSSPQGAVFVDFGFNHVDFYDGAEPEGNSYSYFISK